MDITYKELAILLGVSPSAVSIALNGKSGISEQTRKKIINSAKQYGFTEKKKKSTSHNIRFVVFLDHGTVIHETDFHYFVLEGVEKRARELGYNILISYFDSLDNWNLQMQFLTQNIAGLIIMGTELNETHFQTALEHNILSLNFPIIIIGNDMRGKNIDSIIPDNYGGVYKATSYLLEHHHTNIGYIRSRQRIQAFEERYAGYLQALYNNHLSPIPEQIIEVDISAKGAFNDLSKWLNTHKTCATAYLIENNMIASGCIAAFHLKGLKIPKDVSVIGFDNLPICEILEPPLTSINVNKENLGSFAVNILYNRIKSNDFNLNDNRNGAIHAKVSTSLSERSSVCIIP